MAEDSRHLDVISECVKIIKENTGEYIDIDNIPLDDKKTYEMLSDGGGIGVFQLESSPMRALTKSLVPESIDDIAALVALYRPGPMAANMHNDYADRKNGRQEINYPHPDAEEILEGTYGITCYQESLMAICQKFAGYDLGDSYMLLKSAAKKNVVEMAKHEARLIQGCIDNGYGKEVGEMWWSIIKPFADYAFNKCLTGDTQVLTSENTLMTIDELAETEDLIKLKSYDSKTDSIIDDVFSEVIDSGSLEVFEVEFDNGTKIEATLDHKFMSIDNEYVTLAVAIQNNIELKDVG